MQEQHWNIKREHNQERNDGKHREYKTKSCKISLQMTERETIRQEEKESDSETTKQKRRKRKEEEEKETNCNDNEKNFCLQEEKYLIGITVKQVILQETRNSINASERSERSGREIADAKTRDKRNHREHALRKSVSLSTTERERERDERGIDIRWKGNKRGKKQQQEQEGRRNKV